MRNVRPKKSLGQHFLTDDNIAQQIVESLQVEAGSNVLEIGPGTGVLTKFLTTRDLSLKALDLDLESINYLKEQLELGENIIHGDFLKYELSDLFPGNFSIIGNFPYNISSQIFFKVIDHRDQVDQVVCMLQREVADRIASPPGKKAYGIISIFIQCYYHTEKLFDVPPEVFRPPPKVWSSVIRLKRNNVTALNCDEKLFKKVVKSGFQMRRKTLRNALKGLNLPASIREMDTLDKRAEQLSISDFERLTNLIESYG